MALSYSDSADLMNDTVFRGRIKVAALHFANYVMGESPGTSSHNTRFKWAQAAYLMPDQTAMNLQPIVVMDSNVQAQGAAVDDPTLQTAVETAINTII